MKEVLMRSREVGQDLKVIVKVKREKVKVSIKVNQEGNGSKTLKAVYIIKFLRARAQEYKALITFYS